jgi:hypothetical protein
MTASHILIDSLRVFWAAGADFLPAVGGGLTLAVMLGVAAHSPATGSILSGVRRWHGGIGDQFSAIDNMVAILERHQPEWSLPPELLAQLVDNRDRLQELIQKCRSPTGSTADREARNSLLKETLDICLLKIKLWAFGQFAVGVIALDDLHLLGFLLPGESGGYHKRKAPTRALAEATVKVINGDFVRVVISHSAGENAAQVAHGWPAGVRQALIVIVAADGKTEVYRRQTTRLHNDIRLPDGSHGQQFIVKAAFLRHVNDEPLFGPDQTFSMPLATTDLVAGRS